MLNLSTYTLIILQLFLTLILPNLSILFLGFGLITIMKIYSPLLQNGSASGQNEWSALTLYLCIMICIFIIGIIINESTVALHPNRRSGTNQETLKNSPLTISLVTPCIPPDINKLDNLILNINQQFKLPNEMIIALSETNDKECLELENKLNKISKFKVKISGISDKAFAGINRNRGANLAISEYISFIDADDLMHPERLKIISEVIEKYEKPQGIVHGFTYGKLFKEKLGKVNTWDTQKFLNYHNKYPRSKTLHYPSISLHHGHPTYKKSVFNDVKFTNRQRKQDAEMLRNVVDFYKGGIVYIKAPLTAYKQRPRIYN